MASGSLRLPTATTLVAALAAWLPAHWLLLSRLCGACSCGLAASLLAWLLLLLAAGFVWRRVARLLAARKEAKELRSKKVRLWNKLEGLGSPMANAKTICVEEFLSLRQRIRAGSVEAVDALEAFQAKTLQLDVKYKKVHEMVFDADVKAFLLAGREADTLLPGATFYFNAQLRPRRVKDEDGEEQLQEQPVLEALVQEGALPLAEVNKGLEIASSLLLQHGAHFFVGQFAKSQLRDVVSAIVKKPIFATILSRDVADDQFLAILACEAELPSLVAAAITPGLRDQVEQPIEDKQRVGYLYIGQRQSQAHGKRLEQAAVAEMLRSAGEELVELPADQLLAASDRDDAAGLQAEVERLLQEHSLTGLAIVSGNGQRLVVHLASFMEISIFSLTDHLTEAYLCHPHDKVRAGVSVAQSFGKRIRL